MYVAFKTNDEKIIEWLNSQENKSQAIKNILSESITQKEIINSEPKKVEIKLL